MPASIRWEKEARALFWPWLTVISIAALHPLWDYHGYTLFGFFLGIPFLAALSFGHEFQHGTMAQLLSQPVTRLQIWVEKLTVMAIAVITASAAYAFVWRTQLAQSQLRAAGLYLVVMSAPAVLATLLARSTLGGIVLSWLPMWSFWGLTVFMAIYFPTSLLGKFPQLFQGDISEADNNRQLALLFPSVIAYAGFSLWVGLRQLRRFQATGERTGEDIFANLPRLLPERITEWMRSRRDQPLLNLLRKEFRLLRPVWMLAVLFLLYMAFIAALGVRPPDVGRGTHRPPEDEIAFIVPFVAFVPMAALLAGCLGLGEERKWGTHSWHLTLPVSARRQWLTKLLIGVFTAEVCALLLPVLVFANVSYLAGSLEFQQITTMLLHGSVVIGFITVISFWCGCVGTGTVAGALWVFPVLGVISLSAQYGLLGADYVSQTTGTLRDFVVSWLQLNPYSYPSILHFESFWIWVLVPVFGLAIVQSRRLFRTQPEDNILWMLRRLLPLVLVALMAGFLLTLIGDVTWDPYGETMQALSRLNAGGSEQQFSATDLDRALSFSPATRRWLRGASVSVAPLEPSKGYNAVIHLSNGMDCKVRIRNLQGRTMHFFPTCAPVDR